MPTCLKLPRGAKPACDPDSRSQVQRKPRAIKRGKNKPRAIKRGENKTVPTAPRRRRRGFPRFPELPAELRLAIWEFALPDGPRLVLPRFLEIGGTAYQFGFPFYISHVGPPPLFWACREANAVALKGVATATLRGPWVDLRDDILFVPFQGNMLSEYRSPMSQLIGPAPTMSVHRAPQIAVEIPSDIWSRRFAQYMIHCQKLIRLFLVVSCQRPTQKALKAGWSVAEGIHRREQYNGLGLPVQPSTHPPPEIIILLKRKNYEFPAGTWSMDSKDFLSKFMAVAYKPDGPQPKIGRHGVLQFV